MSRKRMTDPVVNSELCCEGAYGGGRSMLTPSPTLRFAIRLLTSARRLLLFTLASWLLLGGQTSFASSVPHSTPTLGYPKFLRGVGSCSQRTRHIDWRRPFGHRVFVVGGAATSGCIYLR